MAFADCLHNRHAEQALGSPCGAEAAAALFPGRVIKVAFVPIASGLLECVPPRRRLLLGGGAAADKYAVTAQITGFITEFFDAYLKGDGSFAVHP